MSSFIVFILLIVFVAVILLPIFIPLFLGRKKITFFFEKFFQGLFTGSTLISVSITFLILFSIIFEASIFFGLFKYIDSWLGTSYTPDGEDFKHTPIWDFVTGTHWSIQSDSYGILPLLIGSLLITIIAVGVAAPLGIFAAIYMAEYATPNFRNIAKPVLEILAGIPTVVYGFFAALIVAPYIKQIGGIFDLHIALESALAAGLVMGMMIIPFIISMSDDAINSVPQSLRDASYSLGATKSETIKKIIIPAAIPGILGAVLLAVSRAIGETMIVVMAAGLMANLTINPLNSVTTITAQIVDLLTGDIEFNSPKTLAAFALGLVLFILTLLLNILALKIVQKYRKKYE